jgi:AraC-like DNA-binding protein
MRSKIPPLFLSQLDDGARTALLTEYSLPADAHQLEELCLPVNRFRALAARVARLRNDPLLGLHTAMGLRPGTYGILEFLLRSAPTPRDALRQLLRFVPLFNNLIRFSLIENGDRAVVEASIPGEPLCLGREGNEFTLAVFVALGRQLAGEDWAPEHVSFAHPATPGVEELSRFFRSESISFGTGYLGLRFKVPDLAKRVRTEDGALHSFLEREASALVSRSGPDELGMMREAVRGALRGGEPSVGEVAGTLGMSARTLQRRLGDQGTSFRELVDQVREGLAREYLDHRSLSLKEVATLLGYADVRAFGRAYKRWTGRTPGSELLGGHRDAAASSRLAKSTSGSATRGSSVLSPSSSIAQRP